MDQTAICNLALLRLGQAVQIASITEQTTAGRACNAVYESCVRTMLRERAWPFATRQVDLALVGEQQITDWYYTYRYPSDYINVHRVVPLTQVDDSTVIYNTTSRVPQRETYPFKIGSDTSGRLIHTNVSEAVALGTVYITDTALYDPMFASALAWFIAAEIALSMTKNRDLYANALSEYQRVVSEAFATAQNEVKPEDKPDADMIEARQ